jgi:hypothetical protein
MSGHIAKQRASGGLQGALPALTSLAEWVPLDAEMCASGKQTWTAYKVGGRGPTPAVTRQIRIMHVRHADGTVSQTMTVSGGG